jgi:hypothetical protein
MNCKNERNKVSTTEKDSTKEIEHQKQMLLKYNIVPIIKYPDTTYFIFRLKYFRSPCYTYFIDFIEISNYSQIGDLKIGSNGKPQLEDKPTHYGKYRYIVLKELVGVKPRHNFKEGEFSDTYRQQIIFLSDDTTSSILFNRFKFYSNGKINIDLINKGAIHPTSCSYEIFDHGIYTNVKTLWLSFTEASA